MKKKKGIEKSLVLLVVACLTATFITPIGTAATMQIDETTKPIIERSPGETSVETIHLEYEILFQEPTFQEKNVNSQVFTKIEMPGTFSIGWQPGTPMFQVQPVKIVLPPESEVVDISVIAEKVQLVNGDSQEIDLKEYQPITPFQPEIPIGTDSGPFQFDQEAYQSIDPVPGEQFRSLGVGYCRGYQILTVNLFPTEYIPGRGEFLYCSKMTIQIDVQEIGEINRFFRVAHLDDRAWVESLVLNPEVLATYDAISEGACLGYEGGLCDPSDNNGQGYDYVIITRQALLDFPGTPYNWDDLIGRKQAEGLDATKIAVEDIIACPDYWNLDPLFNDTPARIREFCRDAYEDWEISYVLVGGDQDGPNNIQRRLMDSQAEYNVESDLYWSNLDKTFNGDHDNYWGESSDPGFDPYSELFIGSIPCDEGADISNWLTKSFYYADDYDQDYLENAAFYGGNTGWNCEGDDFVDYSAIKGTNNWLGPIPEEHGPYPSWLGFQYGFETWNANNPGLEYNLSVKWTAEPPNPGGWQGGSEYAAITGLRNAINADQVTMISAIAHANPYISLDVYNTDWESLYHNTKPFFITDMGCHCGDMDDADDGVLHSMLFHSNTELAFACVYNTGYGWGAFDDTNSSSALQQKCFWDYMFDVANNSGSTMNWQLGKAQAWSKDTMANTINWTYPDAPESWREIIQCCLLFGDPAQLLKSPEMPDHNVGVSSLNVPSHVLPDQQVSIETTLFNNGANDESDVLVSFRVDDFEVDQVTIPFFESQSYEIVDFLWTPPEIDVYLITVNVSIPGVIEDFYYDNEKSKLVIAGPDVAVTNLIAPTYAAIGRSTTITATIENPGLTDEDIDVYFIVNETIMETDQIHLESGTGTDVEFEWIPSEEGTYPLTIYIEISGEEPYLENNQLSKMVSVFYANGYVLLVDDDAGGTYETYFENALWASAYLYEKWNRDSQGSPSPETMHSYDAVIWFTGNDWGETFSPTDQSNLITYLTNGGTLFATGQDIGYDIGNTNFYLNYLHATYLTDDTGIHTLQGVPDDPIGDGLTISIQGGDGANNQDWPDGISPRSPATTVFDYQGSSYDAGIKCETDGYRVVYFGFGFEAISTMNDRTEVMSRVLQWLLDLQEPTPNLICEGELSWTDIEPEATVEGNFTIENDGDPLSKLDWEINEWPEWGTWTIDPLTGEDLTPEAGSVTINVEVIAPIEENTEFTGEVKIINSENNDDFCVIPVYLKTPYNSPYLNFYEFFIHRFPVRGYNPYKL